jgi:pimeloyl-ACP methyl ester carboxylesterase
MKTRRWIKISFPFILFPFILLVGLYFVGPRPQHAVFDPDFPVVPEVPDELERYIADREALHKLKPDNEARIIWSDSAKKKTKYAVVYLHGFSASQKEGDPVHLRFAKEFGCNLFLSRLSDHGVDTTESLMLFTPDRVWSSAKEALAIGEKLGDKVIIMSTSTGGTLALMLAARYPDKVHALINMSPNIAINNPAAFLLNDPWGLQIARMVKHGKYRESEPDPATAPFWNEKYRLEAAVQLEELIESSMTEETFRKVNQPCLTLYYYRNEEEQDPEVKVSAILDMNESLGTPDSLKVITAVPLAGAHVLGSSLVSHDVEGVYAEIEKFAISKLAMKDSSPLTVLNVPATQVNGHQ